MNKKADRLTEYVNPAPVSASQLIASLTNDLQPVTAKTHLGRTTFLWGSLSWGYIIAIILVFGPLREGAFSQLATHPQFFLETLLGLVVSVCLAIVAFQSSTPGALSKSLRKATTILGIAWLACYVFGLIEPALEPSMFGKRPHCFIESMLYGVPPLLASLLLTRRLYPLKPLLSGVYLSLSAGIMPALIMQVACMYDPFHTLFFHLLPGAILVLPGTLCAFWVLRKN